MESMWKFVYNLNEIWIWLCETGQSLNYKINLCEKKKWRRRKTMNQTYPFTVSMGNDALSRIMNKREYLWMCVCVMCMYLTHYVNCTPDYK